MTYHAHITTTATDCDGRIDNDWVEIPRADEDEFAFEGRVLHSLVSLVPDQQATLIVTRMDDGEATLDYSEATEEGFRARQVEFCRKASCNYSEVTYRDHRAESMNY